ncbi:hypothetical protein LuPra_02655 [Luteitalea pratensis]|uniref:Uncharacterized protein n=2 Tax=Luteitalea pratensis TaxID=1855912 RepID=A0A143PMX8_LUTPR|nr:hypothetical protein LuPra_02655 [Luteitalea pratensis]
MRLHETAFAESNRVSPRAPSIRRAGAVAMATGLAVIVGLSLSDTATAANKDGPPECTNRTLQGDYGILVSGSRGLDPGVTESFVGTALRTYDGDGQFTQIDNGHGEITGFRQNVQAYSTYEVHANCSGTSLIYFPGAPSPVETAFVIVAHGDEVKDAVMAPARNIVTASLWRVGR